MLAPTVTVSSLMWPSTTMIGTTTSMADLFNYPWLNGGYHNLLYAAPTATPTANVNAYYQNFVYATSLPRQSIPPLERPIHRPAIVVDPEGALERSLSLFRRLRPKRELDRFLSGKPIRVHGHRFDYQLTKTMDPLSHTRSPNTPHIPYDLRVMTKGGKILSKGCVVVPGTPVIDQVLALILNVEDREEEQKIIHLTNWDTPRQVALAA